MAAEIGCSTSQEPSDLAKPRYGLPECRMFLRSSQLVSNQTQKQNKKATDHHNQSQSQNQSKPKSHRSSQPINQQTETNSMLVNSHKSITNHRSTAINEDQSQTNSKPSNPTRQIATLPRNAENIWLENQNLCDIIYEVPSPSEENAFAKMQLEATRPQNLKSATGTGYGTEPSSSLSICSGLITRNSIEKKSQPHPRSNAQSSREAKDKDQLVCGYCRKHRHTKDECFQLIGYPEWWDNHHNKPKVLLKKNTTARVAGTAMMVGGSKASCTQHGGRDPLATVTDLKKATINRNSNEGDGAAVAQIGNEEETARVWNKGDRVMWGIKGTTLSNLHLSPSVFPILPSVPINTPYLQSEPLDNKEYFSCSPNSCESNLRIPNKCSTACAARTDGDTKNSRSIFDCGATDTMTYDASDIIQSSRPLKTSIQTASGEINPVQRAGTIEISPKLKISNCLYVPSLSHKLLSISHITKELNCTVLMHPHFCILQDIRTGEIIGRGTERQGLYYVDEFAQQGVVMLSRGSADRQAWLWHRRLGHPSTGYLKHLFPNLDFSQPMNCETCVLAKSHRHTFKPNNTRVNSIFSLVHSDV